MDKRFWGIIGVVGLIFLGFLVFRGDNTQVAKGSGTNHVRGTGSIKLVEYGDYQCPYCSVMSPIVNEVVEKYKDRITFQYRNFPIQQIHENAFSSARAAEAADQQGKFWEMHDLLYQNQDSWKSETNAQELFNTYAKQLGLDVTKFTTDFKSAKINSLINGDKAEFSSHGFDPGTPTFTLNGKKIEPEADVKSFSKIIDAELAKKKP